mmetsp:Transcript_32692/g.70114  ORF Transcript_32692/g.70114 Transcript_32692/m.70114 type:complete len:920 (-) Transcript_32692:65-2824(-)
MSAEVLSGLTWVLSGTWDVVKAVVQDTYIEASIIAIAMIIYMRISQAFEPFFWRIFGYDQDKTILKAGGKLSKVPSSQSITATTASAYPSSSLSSSCSSSCSSSTSFARARASSALSGSSNSSCSSSQNSQNSLKQSSQSPSFLGLKHANGDLVSFFSTAPDRVAQGQFSGVVADYERLVRHPRADLSEKVRKDAQATAAFAAVGEALVEVATGKCRSSVNKLIGEMRTFGFPRGREFYSAVMKGLTNKHFVQDMLWMHDVMIADDVTPDRAMYVCLLNAAISAQQDRMAILFFKEICKGGIPSMRTYMTILRIYNKNQDWRGAVELLEGLKRSGGEPDTLALNTVMGICVQASEMEEAHKLFKQWVSKADSVSCNILLKGYTRCSDVVKAEQLFQRMLATGPKPNIISFNTMMDCSVRALQETGASSKWTNHEASGVLPASNRMGTKRVWELLDQLDGLGLEPDRYTVSTLVKGMHLAGCNESDIDRAIALIQRVNFAAPAASDDGNTRLMEVLFNSLLDACVNLRDLDRMAEIVTIMKNSEVVISAVTFGTLMKAFGHAGQLDACHEVWQNMRTARVRPTIVTYGCYIDACIRNSDLTSAQELFQSMAKDGVRPNAVVYTSMIRGYAHIKQPLKALALYAEMRQDRIEPTAVTFNSVLDVIARQLADTDSDKLQEVIDDMRAADITPDAVTYSILIKASCNTGHLDNAIALFRLLRKHGIAFDEVAFNALLLACAKADRLKEAEEIFQEMLLAEGTPPTLVTISILVKLYGKAKMLDKALEVSSLARNKYNLHPNLYLFTCLIQACVRNRHIKKSWQVFGQMFESGVIPDAIAYGTVIHGCVYHSKFEEAMTFVRHAYGVGQPKALASLVDLPPVALSKHAVPLQLQGEVLSALRKALQKKNQHGHLQELDTILKRP